MLFLLLSACVPGTDDTSDTGDTVTVRDPVALSMIAFNVEGLDSTPEGLAELVFDEVEGEAIWALSEVPNESFVQQLAVSAGGDADPFEYVYGTTGGRLHLALMWDPSQVELTEWWELDALNIAGTARAPLVGAFTTVASDEPFLVVNNHLWRSEERYRHTQATGLNEWVQEQTLPAVALGDFNFDWDVPGGEDSHDLGYDLMTEDGHWTWVVPDELVVTQCSGFYNSILDFVFVGNAAQQWGATSIIREQQNSYCRDDETRSDHRPVQADFLIP